MSEVTVRGESNRNELNVHQIESNQIGSFPSGPSLAVTYASTVGS